MKSYKKPVSPGMLRFRNAMIIFLFTSAAIVFSVCFLYFFRVKTLKIESTLVPEPVISDAADIKSGRHLYALNEEKIAERIKEASPYIKSISFKREFPSTLHIFVEEYHLAYYIEYEEKTYLITDTFLVIEETTPEEAGALGAIPLTLPKLKDPQKTKDNPDPPKILAPGTILSFETASNQKWALSLLQMIEKTDFSEKITEIDLSVPMALTFNISGQYTVLLGNEKDFQKKLNRTEHALHYLEESEASVLIGTIHAEKDAPITFTFHGTIESNG